MRAPGDEAKVAIGFSGERKLGQARPSRSLFSPEFRNRLDEVVNFTTLSPEVMGRVVDKFLVEVQAKLSEKKVTLELTDSARQWLAEKGYDPDFGARPLARVLQVELSDRLTDELLFGGLIKGGAVTADHSPGADQLSFEIRPRT